MALETLGRTCNGRLGEDTDSGDTESLMQRLCDQGDFGLRFEVL